MSSDQTRQVAFGFHDLLRALLSFRRVRPQQHQRIFDVYERRQDRHRTKILKDEADIPRADRRDSAGRQLTDIGRANVRWLTRTLSRLASFPNPMAKLRPAGRAQTMDKGDGLRIA